MREGGDVYEAHGLRRDLSRCRCPQGWLRSRDHRPDAEPIGGAAFRSHTYRSRMEAHTVARGNLFRPQSLERNSEMALDQSKIGRVVAEQMEAIEGDYGDDCEIGDVCTIVEVVGRTAPTSASAAATCAPTAASVWSAWPNRRCWGT